MLTEIRNPENQDFFSCHLSVVLAEPRGSEGGGGGNFVYKILKYQITVVPGNSQLFYQYRNFVLKLVVIFRGLLVRTKTTKKGYFDTEMAHLCVCVTCIFQLC
jgi:hypothetical protein